MVNNLTSLKSEDALTLLNWICKSVNEEIVKRDNRIKELEFKLNLMGKEVR